MKNRDGSISNGYFASSDHAEDIFIADNGHMADSLARSIGLWCYIRHRLNANIRTVYLKIRRAWKEYEKN